MARAFKNGDANVSVWICVVDDSLIVRTHDHMNGGESDPYRKWLDIHEKDQPPNHCHVLNLEVFKDDRDVIDAHANKQMVYLQSYASGAAWRSR